MSPSAGKSPPSTTRSSSSYDIKDVRPEFSNEAVEKVTKHKAKYFFVVNYNVTYFHTGKSTSAYI